ncbi:MAG TPA: hypothetical protein VF200_01880 [Woeseiaceae bacterium]
MAVVNYRADPRVRLVLGVARGLPAVVAARIVEVLDSDLVGIAEIAEEHHISKQGVSMWAQREPDFPEPVRRLASGPVHSAARVGAWRNTKEREKDVSAGNATESGERPQLSTEGDR